jgi:endonuclease/exonuclease/phosphatase family metal-dependent hydrolase
VEIGVAGTTVDFYRGYAAVDATVNGFTYRFVNTHLEVGSADPFNLAQGAQAQELMTTLAAEELPIILLGDFNSSPVDLVAPAYSIISGAGYTDAWNTLSGAGDGYTFGFSEYLDEPGDMYERIDLVWTRDGIDLEFESTTGYVVGTDPDLRAYSEIAETYLWPSDHAGVVTTIRMTMP